MMDNALLDLLRSVDTPTVCNAIEVAQGKRGFADFTRGTMLSSAPDEPAIVGYARTAKIAALHPSGEPPATLRERRMAYYRYMAEAPRPAVTVIEDIDFPNCVGAYWGEINTNIHKGFGISGALTNGVMRDLGDLAEGFPVVAGSVGPSHAFVHVRELGTPVAVFGLTIRPGELLHSDRHGAVVIPKAVVDHLHAAILKLLETEEIVLDATRRDDFDFNVLEAAWTAFEKART
jgi:regulator of RNase E activity RraA